MFAAHLLDHKIILEENSNNEQETKINLETNKAICKYKNQWLTMIASQLGKVSSVLPYTIKV